MAIDLPSPPENICILRLSALGDVTHVLPTLRTIQKAWPKCKITWIIGKLEHSLVGDIPNVEFIVFDKSQGVKAYLQLAKDLKGRSFDHAFVVGRHEYRVNVVDHGEGYVTELRVRPVKLFNIVPGIPAIMFPPWLVAYLIIVVPSALMLKRALRIY